MTAPTLRLGTDEMWTLLEHLDLVGMLRDGLFEPGAQPGELSMLETGLLSFHDAITGQHGEFPAEDLRALCTAGLAALAARLLLANGVVTAGVVGPRLPAQWHLGVLGRYVPNVSHIAVFTADRTKEAAVDARVLDQLDLNGIGVSVASSVADAVLGATLVVTQGRAGRQIGYDQLARGTLLVNADNYVVSDDLREGVARRYSVDDLLGMLAGDRHGRIQFDEIVLVELLESGRLRDLDVALAHRLVRSALRLGVGVRDKDGATS
jgi:hypothetical protein